ncbi:MAG: hypothetical protein AAFX52_13125 [Pseudomonadota bacterium]
MKKLYIDVCGNDDDKQNELVKASKDFRQGRGFTLVHQLKGDFVKVYEPHLDNDSFREGDHRAVEADAVILIYEKSI